MRRAIILTGVLFFSLSLVAFAAESSEPTAPQKIVGEIGMETSYIKYKEPGVMKESGIMYGLAGSVAYHNKLMLKAEGRGAWGPVDYKGTGTINNIDDYLLEARGLLGYDFAIGNNDSLTPFAGFGYRYLNDFMKGKTSSTGAAGYERESNYFYLPIGLENKLQLKDGWALGATLEYDIFLWGKQLSHLGNAVSGAGTVNNKQDDGYGARGSVRLQKEFKRVNFFVEPFIRYWNIKQSKISNIAVSGTIWGFGWEPKNNSTEIGLQIGFVF